MPDFFSVLKQLIILAVSFIVFIIFTTRVIVYIVNQDEETKIRYVLYRYINNDKKIKVSIKTKYFNPKTLNLLINTFAPLNDIYDNFKSAKKDIKKEFKHLYIKYSVQLNMIKDSLTEIQKMLKRSNEIEKQEIYIRIKKDIKKDIKPLILKIETDSKIIISNHEKYLNDKDNAIRQLTKKELENKVLFNINKIEIDELKEKYSKKNQRHIKSK